MTDDRARIQQAVLDWVREDCGAQVKMSLQRHHIERLVDRICNPKAQPVPIRPATPPREKGKKK